MNMKFHFGLDSKILKITGNTTKYKTEATKNRQQNYIYRYFYAMHLGPKLSFRGLLDVRKESLNPFPLYKQGRG